MVAVEIRKTGRISTATGTLRHTTSTSATGTLPEKHESLANNLAADAGNRTVKTADDQRHDNARIGELAMRYGQPSQLAPLDCTSSRRSTVMCALLRLSAVTTEYQRDSSSKRPLDRASSSRFDNRTRPRGHLREGPEGHFFKK